MKTILNIYLLNNYYCVCCTGDFGGIDPPESFLRVFGFALAGPVSLLQKVARSPLPYLKSVVQQLQEYLSNEIKGLRTFFVLLGLFCSTRFVEQSEK